MSSILAMANSIVDWKRVTALVLDSVAVASSHTPDRQPVRTANIQVALTGTPTGTVTVVGTVGGVSDSEVLTWAGAAGFRATTKQFTAVSSITTSLSGATLISVTAVGVGGDPQPATSTVRAGIPVQLQRSSPRWGAQAPGMQPADQATIRVQYEEIWTPRAGDLVVADTGETWEVGGRPVAGGGLYPDHWVCTATLAQGRT